MRTYETPAAFKTALDGRLRARAKATSGDVTRERQLFIFDRLVTRMNAAFGARVVVKGGFVLELRLDAARTTKDVDFRMTGSATKLFDEIQVAGQLDLGDRLRFEIARAKHATITGGVYDGQRFTARAMLGGRSYGNAFGIDVAFGDVLVEEPDTIVGDDALLFVGIAPPLHRIYPRSAHLAEKLHAYTLPGDRPNTRVKDLPDIALLATTGTFDAATLRRSITATFRQRATHEPPASLPMPPATWAAPYERIASIDSLPWESLDGVARAASVFLDPVLAGIVGTWDAQRFAWGT